MSSSQRVGSPRALVGARSVHIGTFLSWAASQERTRSLRLAERPDIERTRQVIDKFGEPWWAAVVYSCFDSVSGAGAVAEHFHQPIDPVAAEKLLGELRLPSGAVGGHRTQPAHRGAKLALIAACRQADAFRTILETGYGFHDRYVSLRELRATQWGRTTCYDLLVRAGQLGIGAAARYEPDRAYLADSTGPRRGFELLWGIRVTQTNVDECEAILRWWSDHWSEVARQVGARWTGPAYGPGDFENALCIYQERGHPGYGIKPDEVPEVKTLEAGPRNC